MTSAVPTSPSRSPRRRLAMGATFGAMLVPAMLLAPLGPAAAARPRSVPYNFVKGIDTYFTYNCQTANQIQQYAATEVAQYKALGATSIGIGFPVYTSSVTSNKVYAEYSCPSTKYQSPPPGILAIVVQAAHAAGLQVLIRPMVDQENLFAEANGDWRGVLRPKNVGLWFDNYWSMLKPYLEMAQNMHVEDVVLETELDSLAHYSNWAGIIRISRQVYAGTLIWNYSWNTAARKVLRRYTSFGIDAYPKVGLPATATPRQLVRQWNSLLETHTAYLVPNIAATTINEIGIPAQNGAYSAPWKGALQPLSSHKFNQQIQANWFTAACMFVKQHKMRGIYFWGPWLTAHQGSMYTAPNPSQPSNIQPQGAAAIKACFTGS